MIGRYYVVNLSTGEFSPETFINARMATQWAKKVHWDKIEILEGS